MIAPIPASLADLTLQPERPGDAVQVEALIDRAFGPGRLTKVSERVREIADFAPELSICAWAGDRLAGVARQSRITVGGAPVVFLGPLAVEEDQRGSGLGARLVTAACEAARAAGETCVLLVGDAPFFSRLGFSTEPGRDVILPGPVDPARVLVRALAGSQALSGPVGRAVRA